MVTVHYSLWAKYTQLWPLKEVLHLLSKISIFCALSQNYRRFLEKEYMHLISHCKLSKELENGIEIIGQAVFKLWIKTFKTLFGSITQEPSGLLKFTICRFPFPVFYCKITIALLTENYLQNNCFKRSKNPSPIFPQTL